MPTWAQPELQKIAAKNLQNGFQADLVFNQPVDPGNVELEYINQTVQVNIPGAHFLSGKFFRKVENDRVKSIFTYQPSQNLLRTRIIHNDSIKADDLKGFVSIEANGNILSIKLLDPAKELPAEKVSVNLPKIKPVVLEAEAKKEPEDIIKSEMARSSEDEPIQEPTDGVIEDVKKQILQPSIGATSAKKNQIKPTPQMMAAPVVEKAPNANKLAESDIPAFKNSTTAKSNGESGLLRVLASLGVIGLLALGSILFSKWWGKKTKKDISGTTMRIMAQHQLGGRKALMIVQVAGEHLLLGVTDHNINMIKTLSLLDEDISPELPRHFATELDKSYDFDEQQSTPLNQAIHNSKTPAAQIDIKKYPSPANQAPSDQNLSVNAIRDLVTQRLKNMRSLG